MRRSRNHGAGRDAGMSTPASRQEASDTPSPSQRTCKGNYVGVGKKRVAAFLLGAALTFTHLTGQAAASRADGVCGGIGTWDPVTSQCV